MDLTRPLLAVLLLAATFAAGAGQVYKWVDPNGKVRYSDMPQAGWKRVDPATGQVASEIRAEPDPETEGDDTGTETDGAAAEEPAADTETADAADATAESDEPSAELKASECKRRKDQLAGYQNAGRIVETDAKGKEKVYSETERLKLIERTQKQVKELCG